VYRRYAVRFAVSSRYDALRWRAVGKCASQHPVLQKTSLSRPELQAVTEQRMKRAPTRIFFRHMQQTAKTSSGTHKA
jgi:hypothetical protein